MDIVSQPEIVEEHVTDLDVVFLNGVRTITLREGDEINYDRVIRGEPAYVIATKNPEETITLFVKHILGYSVRERIMRRPVRPTGPSRTVLPDPSLATDPNQLDLFADPQ